MTKICKQCNKSKQLSDFYQKKLSMGKIGTHTLCKECFSKNSKEKYSNNKSEIRKHQNLKYKSNPKYYEIRRLKHQFGISLETYNDINSTQNGKCAICHKIENEKYSNGKIKKLTVDHCHKTGNVRGLLCGKCNRALGLFKDSAQTLMSAIQYLTKGIS